MSEIELQICLEYQCTNPSLWPVFVEHLTIGEYQSCIYKFEVGDIWQLFVWFQGCISKTECGKVERTFSKKMHGLSDTRNRQNRCLGQKRRKRYNNRHRYIGKEKFMHVLLAIIIIHNVIHMDT